MGMIDKGPTIYMDLDGPILDVSERYYRVHRRVMSLLGINDRLSKNKYWRIKRSRGGIFALNNKLKDAIGKQYKNKWLSMIEQKRFLIYDKPWFFAKRILETVSGNNNLILVTARMKKRNLFWELRENGLLKYFKRVYVGDPLNAVSEKIGFIRNDEDFDPAKSMIVGDTEVDILCGKKCAITTVAVLNGIRDRSALLALKPDIYINSLKGLLGKFGRGYVE
jgi:phosphoglycolate phosphatase-like HAD superfamily hydrolase